MKYMKQFGIILIVTCIGELLNRFLPLPIPGSIYGLVLMLVLLCTKVVKIDDVKDTAEFLIEIMPMMFIPAAVGLLNAWGTLRPIIVPILIMTVVSTAFVMVVTGKVAQGVMKLRKRETSAEDAEESAKIAQEHMLDSLLESERKSLLFRIAGEDGKAELEKEIKNREEQVLQSKDLESLGASGIELLDEEIRKQLEDAMIERELEKKEHLSEADKEDDHE